MKEEIRDQGLGDKEQPERYFFRACANDFKKIPGSPIAYWVSYNILNLFLSPDKVDERAVKGLDTGGNIGVFLRLWYEVNLFNTKQFNKDSDKWYPLAKGGNFRRWYGNNEYIINYSRNGEELINAKANLRNRNYYFKQGITWTVVSSGGFAVRYLPEGFLFDQGGSSIFLENDDEYSLEEIIGSLNSCLIKNISNFLCPTLNFTTGDVRKFLIWHQINTIINSKKCILISKTDWDSYETSWDFSTLPLLKPEYKKALLKDSYDNLRNHWQEMTIKMKRLEEENNHIFIDAYGLQDELTPDVPIEEITLTCNPRYRYSGNKTDEELEMLQRMDTMEELISYAIGCMMGRFSLDEPGLIYAHSGNIGFDPTRYKIFPADADGIVPITDIPWFNDDAAIRIRDFLLGIWGEETLEENMVWLAESLGMKSGESPEEVFRRYISTNFFKDHMQIYKKRPIYWLFSSGKQKAFECLVYLHRYNESTLSRMRSEYVTPLQGKLKSRIEFLSHQLEQASSTSEKKKVTKELETLKKKQDELKAFDEELRHYADMKIKLDLDDGVKVNYGKFGSLLANVKDICGKDED
jgi:type II restriction/modification system DNA methylase subunit YeeA